MGPKTPGTTGADFQKHIDELFELEEKQPEEEPEEKPEEKEEGAEGDKKTEDE